MSTITIYSIGVSHHPRGNAHGYTATDYARRVAAEINKKAAEQGYSTERSWFERELESARDCIGADLLYIDSSYLDTEEE